MMSFESESEYDWGKLLLPFVFFFLFLYLGARFLGTTDFTYVAMWWGILLVFGLIMQPLAIVLFNPFHDGGWIFSKALGIGVCGWLMWFLASVKLVKFTRAACFICSLFCFIVGVLLFYFLVMKKNRKFRLTQFYTPSRVMSMLSSEVVFFCLLVFWCYLKGTNPAAYGTERYMDYGYMLSMFKSDYMPPKDMWYAGEGINYYYVGQYMATFISKMSGVPVTHGYNIAMMMLAVFGFCMPYSLVVNLVKTRLIDRQNDLLGEKEKKNAMELGEVISKREPFFRPIIGGTLAGLAVSFSGSLQYPIFKFIVPKIRSLLKKDPLPNYWFANATRYIGYYPERDDKPIHEFPLYSYVIGDLHAHVINTIFVMTVLAILFAWMLRRKALYDSARVKSNMSLGVEDDETSESMMLYENEKRHIKSIYELRKDIFDPAVITCSFLIGIFHMTNYWDFPIYFVVSGAIILFTNLIMMDFRVDSLLLTACQAVVFIVIGTIVSLPFTLTFDSISTGIGLTSRHTMFHEFLVVWGLPFLCLVTFFLSLILSNRKENRRHKKDKRPWIVRFFTSLTVSELYVLTIALCAAGLVLLPEIIFVRDIYGGAYERSNTMFKLTYQAFIMFGISMAYIVSEFVFIPKSKVRKAIGCFVMVLMIISVGYFNECYQAWFGGNYTTLDASAFLKQTNADDAEMIDYINENIEGQPVIAEMGGLSYTYFNRVSVFTGCPTVIGWQTHEWLWRSEGNNECPQEVFDRENDILTLYSSQDIEEVKRIIDKYNIEYIYVGECERTYGYEQIDDSQDKVSVRKYIEGQYYRKIDTNLSLLLTLGTVEKCIPTNENKYYATYLIKVAK